MTRETVVRTCQVCGKPRWQKHAEVCTGPPVERKCTCPPGYMHDPSCYLVTHGETADA